MDLSLSSRLNLSITSWEIEFFNRDGSGVLGNLLDIGWVELMREA